MDSTKLSGAVLCEGHREKNTKIYLALTNLSKNYPGQLDLTYDDEGDNVYATWTNKTPIEVVEEARSRLGSAYLTMKSLIEYCMRDYNASGLIPISSKDKIDAEDVMLLQWLRNEICREMEAKSEILALLISAQRKQNNENAQDFTNEGKNTAKDIHQGRSMNNNDKVNKWLEHNVLTNKLIKKELIAAVREGASNKLTFLKKVSTLMEKHCR